MEIAVIGTGYVGLVTGVCLAEIGNKVTCIDIDEAKIATLKKGISPIYEAGLTELLEKNINHGNLDFTTDYKTGTTGKRVIYIAVGTPQGEDGSADLSFIDAACKDIATHLTADTIIVTKSTVPVGTNEYIKHKIESHLTENVTIKIVSNPEFLRQGSAVHDTFNGDRIVIGSEDKEALEVIATINAPYQLPVVKTDLRSAEMIKYAANAFLATKISFINEMANLCEKVDANIENVAQGIGMDKRIGDAFLNAGTGYGGSCFPKDTRAVISIGKQAGYEMPILENVVSGNEQQRGILVDKILERFGEIKGKKIALLGLAFKPNTDDMREAPSIIVSERLLKEGATLHAYDPVAIENAKKVLSTQLHYASSIDEAIDGADITIILTEWEEVKKYPIENYKQLMSRPVIFDGRNIVTLEDATRNGVEYHSIGRPTMNQLI